MQGAGPGVFNPKRGEAGPAPAVLDITVQQWGEGQGGVGSSKGLRGNWEDGCGDAVGGGR